MSPSVESTATAPKKCEVDPALIEKYRRALHEFRVPEESELRTKEDNSIRQHPSEDVEGYFEWVTRHGKPILPWKVIQPAFVWKIKFVMDEMIRLDRARLKGEETLNFSEDSPLKLGYDFIIERSHDFEGAPFTFQRICELLHTPSRHYKKAEKFIRALDKTINVVTTVTEAGIRVSGAEWPMPLDTSTGKVEQHFFGKVDELDGEDNGVHTKREGETATITDKIVGPMLPTVVAEAAATPAGDQNSEPIDMCTRPKEEATEAAKKEEPMEM